MATFVVNGGLSIIPQRLLGLGTEPKYAHWGSGAGTTAASDTSLFGAETEARIAGTSSRVTGPAPNNTNDTYQVVASLVNGDPSQKTITNSGLFDASTAGTMFMKGDFTGIPVSQNEGIQFTYQIQFKNS